MRRETASAYLKAAGLAVRPAGRWGHRAAKPAIEVSTDPVAPAAVASPSPLSVAAPAAARARRQRLRAVPRADRARPSAAAATPWRSGRTSSTITASPRSTPACAASCVTLRGPAAGRGAPGDRHRARRRRPGRLRRRPDGAASGHGQVPPHAAVRLHARLQPQERPPADLRVEHSRAGPSCTRRRFAGSAGAVRGRRPRQSARGRAHARHLRPHAQPALSRRARALRRRSRCPVASAIPIARARSSRRSATRRRAAQGPALRDARGGAGLSRSLGRPLGRHPHPRHHQAPGRRDVRRGAARAAAAARRAVSLLPVRHAHGASRRLRRGRRAPTTRRRRAGSAATSPCSGTAQHVRLLDPTHRRSCCASTAASRARAPCHPSRRIARRAPRRPR